MNIPQYYPMPKLNNIIINQSNKCHQQQMNPNSILINNLKSHKQLLLKSNQENNNNNNNNK